MKCKVTEKERRGEERRREEERRGEDGRGDNREIFLHWFTPQMAATTSPGPGQSPKPGTPSWPPAWVSGSWLGSRYVTSDKLSHHCSQVKGLVKNLGTKRRGPMGSVCLV